MKASDVLMKIKETGRAAIALRDKQRMSETEEERKAREAAEERSRRERGLMQAPRG